MRISLPSEKEEKIVKLLHVLHTCMVKTDALARLVGYLIAVLLAIPLGRAHYRSLEISKLQDITLNKGYRGSCCLSDAAMQDIAWWITHLPHCSVHVHPSPLPHPVHRCFSGWLGSLFTHLCRGQICHA